MKKLSTCYLTVVLVISLFSSCSYTLYGAAMGEEKSTTLASQSQNTLYPADDYPGPFPKSIILIISDGTGIGQYSTLYFGHDDFAPARFEHVGIVTTQPSNGDIKVTDSAAGGTALATGYKTYNGAISVDQNHQPLKTVVEWAEEYGMATGLVATSTISHATPASFGAHVDSRQKEAEISRQLAESSIDVLFGGGSKYWNPDLFDEVRKSGGQVISDISEAVDRDRRVVGLFSSEGMPTANGGRSPSTLQMAKKAIEIIEKDPDGFFIMIEESQVDWGGHSQSADYIFGEMKSLNRVVNFCLDYQRSHPDVLVVLTSDHETGGCAVNDGENGELEIQFTDDHHTANFVPVWASGPGSQAFDAFQDNTEIGKTLIRYIRNK